jgi:hypothetical protein
MNGRKIQYGQLQDEIFRRHGELFDRLGIKWQQVCTKYGHPAGKIGNVLFKLAEEWGERVPGVQWNSDIPPVNAIIVSRDSGLPSDGVEWYIEHYIDDEITDENYEDCINQVIDAVFDYPEWARVAQDLGFGPLEPVPDFIDHADEEDSRALKLPEQEQNLGLGGESEEHKSLKKWLAAHPEIFSEYGYFPEGENEFLLRSGDKVDAVFLNESHILAVEAKTSEASDAELVRGVFQCIKYRSTLRAMQLVAGRLPNAQAVLATQRELRGEVLNAANRLKVGWILVR